MTRIETIKMFHRQHNNPRREDVDWLLSEHDRLTQATQECDQLKVRVEELEETTS